jgi:hypothetical protein
MGHASFGEHFGYEFGDYAAAALHLGLLRVGQVGYDTDYVAGAGRFASVAHNQKFHYVVVGFFRSRLYDENILASD